MLELIRRELEADANEDRVIPKEQILQWMQSRDVDVLGAVYGLLHSVHNARIQPSLDADESFDFLLAYYEYCLEADPESQWANSRYSAGWDLVGWFIQLWEGFPDHQYALRVQGLLEALYRKGTPELKKCIEHAILEHLFERHDIRKFFEHWRTDPTLAPAFDEAILWVKKGGASPLSEKPK